MAQRPTHGRKRLGIGAVDKIGGNPSRPTGMTNYYARGLHRLFLCSFASSFYTVGLLHP